MVFGVINYIDPFLGDFDISNSFHWNYELCNENDIYEYKDEIEDPQFFKSWCVRGFWNATSKKYIKQTEPDYQSPFIAHGTGSKININMGYSIFVAKCQNTSFRTNCLQNK